MSENLRVDTPQIKDLGRQLRNVRDQMANTGAQLDRHEDAIGSRDVVDALRDFESRWERGRRQIQEKSDALSQMLIDSAEAYIDVDNQRNEAMEEAKSSSETVIGNAGASSMPISAVVSGGNM